MIQLSWQVLSDGFTSAPEAVVLRGGSWFRRVRFYATMFLLRHPTAGWVLFDTGYTSRFFDETKRWPERLFRLVTHVTLTTEGGVKELLSRQGIAVDDIKHVFLSHFHADHVGGLKDFPNASVWCSQESWLAVKSLGRWAGLRRGFLGGLLPENLEPRLQFVTEGSDLLGDGSLRVVSLPGHAVGQIGLRFQAPDGQDILLAADACWLSQAFRENRPPHQLTRLLHDWPNYLATLQQLHEMHRAEPELLIVPTHCPETAARIHTA